MKKCAAITFTLLAMAVRPVDAITISTATKIPGAKVYSYHFSDSVILPDYTVKIVDKSFVSDLSLKIVHEPEEADVLFVENDKNADIFVSKASTAIGVKSIKISPTSIAPDITVLLSEDVTLPDYKIYVLSTRFTRDEAAALFAVIWKDAQDRE